VLDPNRLLALDFPEVAHTYTQRDTILYALGVGLGLNPLNPSELRYVFEKNLVALPTMAVTLAYPGYWYRDLETGLDHVRVVHASEVATIHEPLPVEATVVAKPRVVEVVDKGRDKGALVVSERDIKLASSGKILATVRQTALCRGDGGFAATPGPREKLIAPPDRRPDSVLALPTSPQAALIYRLSGDPNPLHVDPEFARAAGFERPILHGLATMGVVCHAAVRTLFGDEPKFLSSMDCRFTSPVYSGDSITSEFWKVERNWLFRAQAGTKIVALGSVAGR
jgi:acyl dehydratase